MPFVAPLPPPPPAVPRQLGGVRVSNGAYGPRAFPFPGVPASCVIDLDRIENGLDARTSVCIKNCPLRLTRDMLESFIWEVAPRSFDFVRSPSIVVCLARDLTNLSLCSSTWVVVPSPTHREAADKLEQLRVDFESHANVGYGFVSFRDVDGLLAFARARLGAKWGCFRGFCNQVQIVAVLIADCRRVFQDRPDVVCELSRQGGSRRPLPQQRRHGSPRGLSSEDVLVIGSVRRPA